ncbi:hypothetical protein MSAN_00466200 [Mycena sanguinolenta]|uniref:Uncharacterized protein n=1 Tax=Mycena sanguinolenta TaxID=230812 RepID=A0A8H6ZF68_9AGAR|nr:hypothetical protein MSAN_00466200 [Mycena sanguinolenta]
MPYASVPTTDDSFAPEKPAIHVKSQFWARWANLVLHLGLVLVHLTLLIIGSRRLEHSITFPVEQQTTVSFWTTAISTTIGTVYCSCLVFLTQRLALRFGTGSQRSLTVVHDGYSSWRGVGSAFGVLYNQFTLPASVLQSLTILLYLGGISILHITIPATLSVRTFDSSVSRDVTTIGLPEFNSSNITSSYLFMATFPAHFLPWVGNLKESQTIGLFNSTLYEALQDTNLGPGIANVSAVGINISCGYVPTESVNITAVDPFQFTFSLTPIGLEQPVGPIFQTDPLSARAGTVQILSQGLATLTPKNSIVIWTTLEVLDSYGNTGNPVMVNGAKDKNNATINHIQVLQCSKSTVAQSVVIDTETGIVNDSPIYPDIYNGQSRWQSRLDMNFTPQDSTLLGGDVWSQMPTTRTYISDYFNVIEENLMQYLNIDPLSNSTISLQLHDIENGLSSIMATIFWIGGHIPPDSIALRSTAANISGVVTPAYLPPVLAAGTTTVQLASIRVRLNVWSGLGTSVILLVLVVCFTVAVRKPVDHSVGPGLLRAIRWSQKHEENLDFVDNVRHPTELNLREAGLDFILTAGAQETHSVQPKTLHLDSGPSLRSSSFANWSKVRCIILHIVLVLLHAILLWMWVAKKDHQIVFQLGDEGTVSVWYKVLSTAIGTSYYSILLYTTQTQAISHAINTHQSLTSIHDRVLSWSGLGSSVATLRQQLAIPASVSAVLAIFGYLTLISVLHITTPALVSVETFNLTVPSQVAIEGLPQLPDSDHETTISYLQNDAEFMGYLSTLDISQTIGLFNGTLYDTLTDVYPGSSLINVSAMGFEVTCGYLPGVVALEGHNNISFGQFGWIEAAITGLDVVTTRAMDSGQMLASGQMLGSLPDPGLSDSIVVYTTNEVLDSSGNSGFPVDLPQVAGTDVNALQFLQCRRYLVNQSAQVDPSSRTIVPTTLTPVIYQTEANWLSFEDLPASTNSGSSLINSSSWAAILPGLRGSGFWIGPLYPTWGDAFLMEELELRPDMGNGILASNRTLYLHEIENALSKLISSVFWMAGHIRPPPLTMKYGFANASLSFANSLLVPMSLNLQKPPLLEQQNITLSYTMPAGRLDLNPLAVSIGLGASLMLLALAITVYGTSDIRTPPSSLKSMGVLQTIWVFRHHPELSEILDDMEDPTDHGLRAAGMVKVRLLDVERSEEKAIS